MSILKSAICDVHSLSRYKRTSTQAKTGRFFTLFLTGVALGYYVMSSISKKFIKNDIHALAAGNGNNLKQFVRHLTQENYVFTNNLLLDMESSEAAKLFREVKILCWISTYWDMHHVKAVHAKATWGRHCNEFLVISESYDPTIPTVKVNASAGREGLWAKTVHAFKLIETRYLEDYDWFLKADDDTYIVVENLRQLLLPLKPEAPGYYGFQFKTIAPKGYMSGGGGYVLSRESVRRLVNEALSGNYSKDCPPGTAQAAEDAEIGRCLHAVGVYPGDSRDDLGRYRFYPFDVEGYVHPDLTNKNWWYWDFIYWPHKGSPDCCSEHPISFHYMTADLIYMMEYLIYNLNMVTVTGLERAETPLRNTTTSPLTTVNTNHT